MKQILKKRIKKGAYKILIGCLLCFWGIYSPVFAEITTTYNNNLNSSSAFGYRSNYSGIGYIFDEQLNSVDGEIQGFAWKNYTIPETIINSSSVGHLKLKAIDTYLSYSYIYDSNNIPFDVCGSNTIYYNFYPLPDTFPNDNELGDSVYTFNKNDYTFILAPQPRRHIAQEPTAENSLSSDGTCPYSITINADTIPAGNYFAVAFSYGTSAYATDWVLPSASDPEMTGDNYETRPYTLAGYGYSPLQSGQTMALGSNTQDTDVVGCNSGICDYYKQDFAFNNVIQPDFYITTDITAPPVVDITSCNPFSSDISTAFLNLDFSLSNCLKDIATYLFIPSTDSTGQFSDLIDTIKQKPPFGWVVGTYDIIKNINITGATATFTLEQITPISELIFDPIRTALSWLLYFVFAFYLFKRFKDINI